MWYCAFALLPFSIILIYPKVNSWHTFIFFITRRSPGSAGPFAVPAHLRQDVEEFEALYDQHNNEYVVRNKKVWEINPKQKSSTLYE